MMRSADELKELLKDAQKRRQNLIETSDKLRQQAQQMSMQANQCLLDAKEIDGEIKAYTLMMDEEVKKE